MGLLMLFFLAFTGAITPGPDILLVMRNTLRFGFWQGIKILSGIATGWIFYLGMLYFGLGYLLSGKITQIILSVFGALYLSYIALMLFKKSATHIALKDSNNTPDTYLKALLINMSNPKAMLFFSVIVAPFIETNLLTGLLVLFCGLSSAFLFVIVLCAFFRHLINDRIFFYIDKICAFLFAAFAILLLYHVYKIV